MRHGAHVGLILVQHCGGTGGWPGVTQVRPQCLCDPRPACVPADALHRDEVQSRRLSAPCTTQAPPYLGVSKDRTGPAESSLTRPFSVIRY